MFRRFLSALMLVALAGCMPVLGSIPHPKITKVEVFKAKRELVLLSHGFPVRRYPIDLGKSPVGPKLQEGDNKTPEGTYHITHLNPDSAYTLSLGLNYPNAQDIARAQAAGVDPGGDIFIHGLPNGYRLAVKDWTNGCVAVSNDAIKEIASLVPVGTPVVIYP